jgi:hypothetical protein
MLTHIIHTVVRVLVGPALGAGLGTLYGGLVGTVHFGLYGRVDQIPAFVAGCVLVGAVLGLLGYMVRKLSGKAARERSNGQNGHPGRPQDPPKSPQVPPRNTRATSLPFVMRRTGRRGRPAEHAELRTP